MNNESSAFQNRQQASTPRKEVANVIITGSDEFVSAPPQYQKFVSRLVEETRFNEYYVATTAIHPNVIEDSNYELLQKISNAQPWFSIDNPPMGNELREDINNYQFVMNVLTSDQILGRDDVDLVVDSALNCKTSAEANEFVRRAFTETITQEMGHDITVESMVAEAVDATIDDAGFRK